MSDYSKIPMPPDGGTYQASVRDSSSLRGAVLKIEAEIDVGTSNLLGLIESPGLLEGSYSEDFRQNLAKALDVMRDVERSIAELDNYLHMPFASADEPFYNTHYNQLCAFKRDIVRIKGTIEIIRKRAELFEGAQRPKEQDSAGLDSYYSTEGQRLTYTNRLADDILEQAHGTRYALSEQWGSLFSVKKRMNRVLSRSPAISALLRDIWKHKNKERIIMGLVLGICFIILAYRLFG